MIPRRFEASPDEGGHESRCVRGEARKAPGSARVAGGPMEIPSGLRADERLAQTVDQPFEPCHALAESKDIATELLDLATDHANLATEPLDLASEPSPISPRRFRARRSRSSWRLSPPSFSISPKPIGARTLRGLPASISPLSRRVSQSSELPAQLVHVPALLATGSRDRDQDHDSGPNHRPGFRSHRHPSSGLENERMMRPTRVPAPWNSGAAQCRNPACAV